MTMTYVDGNPVPGLGQAQKCGGLDQLIRSQAPPLDNCISNGNTENHIIYYGSLFLIAFMYS